jgi:hypothetical protein
VGGNAVLPMERTPQRPIYWVPPRNVERASQSFAAVDVIDRCIVLNFPQPFVVLQLRLMACFIMRGHCGGLMGSSP